MYARMHTQRNNGTKKWAMPSPDGVQSGNEIKNVETKDVTTQKIQGVE